MERPGRMPFTLAQLRPRSRLQLQSLVDGVNIAFPKLVRLPEICYRNHTPLIHCLTTTSAGLGSKSTPRTNEALGSGGAISLAFSGFYFNFDKT